MNSYEKEFTTVTNPEQFKVWMDRNTSIFVKNMRELGIEPTSLRDWIAMFLSWSEYKENKNESDVSIRFSQIREKGVHSSLRDPND